MTIYRLTAFACFGLAVIVVLAGMSSEQPVVVAAGFAVVPTGVLFLGLGKVIQLLQDIRDHHCGSAAGRTKETSVPAQAEIRLAEPTPNAAPRSAEEIAADLQRIKNKH